MVSASGPEIVLSCPRDVATLVSSGLRWGSGAGGPFGLLSACLRDRLSATGLSAHPTWWRRAPAGALRACQCRSWMWRGQASERGESMTFRARRSISSRSVLLAVFVILASLGCASGGKIKSEDRSAIHGIICLVYDRFSSPVIGGRESWIDSSADDKRYALRAMSRAEAYVKENLPELCPPATQRAPICLPGMLDSLSSPSDPFKLVRGDAELNHAEFGTDEEIRTYLMTPAVQGLGCDAVMTVEIYHDLSGNSFRVTPNCAVHIYRLSGPDLTPQSVYYRSFTVKGISLFDGFAANSVTGVDPPFKPQQELVSKYRRAYSELIRITAFAIRKDVMGPVKG